MQTDGFEFDLITQRFIINRWETGLGEIVRRNVIDGLKRGIDVRSILDPYILDHPDSQDPYGHPYYPKDAMDENEFWVLTQDDLRGIKFFNEDFSNKTNFSAKSLNYSTFYNCNAKGANFERTGLTRAAFEKCELESTCFAGSGGHFVSFADSKLENICFWNAGFQEIDFSGSNVKGAYFEDSFIEGITVNYLTVLDRELCDSWENRNMPNEQKPDILKAIRVAYEKAELWSLADVYLSLERSEYRKSFLWKKACHEHSVHDKVYWLVDWFWAVFTGYGVKPFRILNFGVAVAIFFAILFYVAGNPGADPSFKTSLYFSFTTFATLGYGDLSYGVANWGMRLISTLEAWVGAVLIAIFVAVMARKLVRH